jgi:hypothetical protein
MAIARKSTYLILLLHQLELLSIRILLYQVSCSSLLTQGIKPTIRAKLASPNDQSNKHLLPLSMSRLSVRELQLTSSAYPGHMYALSLLLLEHEDVLGPAASLVTVDDVIVGPPLQLLRQVC